MEEKELLKLLKQVEENNKNSQILKKEYLNTKSLLENEKDIIKIQLLIDELKSIEVQLLEIKRISQLITKHIKKLKQS